MDADLDAEMVLLMSVVLPMSVEVDLDEGTLDLEVVLLLPKEVDVDEETLVLEEETLEVRGWEEADLDEEAFELDFVVTVDVCFLYLASMAA